MSTRRTSTRFIDNAGALSRYLPRLKGPKERRDEAFAEQAPRAFIGLQRGDSLGKLLVKVGPDPTHG